MTTTDILQVLVLSQENNPDRINQLSQPNGLEQSKIFQQYVEQFDLLREEVGQTIATQDEINSQIRAKLDQYDVEILLSKDSANRNQLLVNNVQLQLQQSLGSIVKQSKDTVQKAIASQDIKFEGLITSLRTEVSRNLSNLQTQVSNNLSLFGKAQKSLIFLISLVDSIPQQQQQTILHRFPVGFRPTFPDGRLYSPHDYVVMDVSKIRDKQTLLPTWRIRLQEIISACSLLPDSELFHYRRRKIFLIGKEAWNNVLQNLNK